MMDMTPVAFGNWIAEHAWIPSMMASNLNTLVWRQNGFDYEDVLTTLELYMKFLLDTEGAFCKHERITVSKDGKEHKCHYCHQLAS